ncbi:alpha/beta hydrolase [Streptacidiphilus sp. EB129]|uniref:alpha/beta hydrolase n=1 Tax=Streptacidiphilus sp. EB129 TaxID=3156262 RepID=UPI0035190089
MTELFTLIPEAGSLAAAGLLIDDVSEACGALADNLASARSAYRARWSGAAAARAGLALARQRGRLTAAHLQLRALGSLLGQAAEEFRQHRSELGELLDAERPGAGVLAPSAATAIDRVRAAADRTDQWLAAELALSVAQAADPDGPDLPAADARLRQVTARLAAALPPPGSNPGLVHDWWRRLGPDARRMLVRDQPQLVGSLDGVPCAVRDQANRLLLDRLVADSDRPEALLALRDRLRREADGGSPPVLLLALGTAGQGRAVLSFGDPDTATHICAYVPGMGTRLADAAGKEADRALAVQQASGPGTAALVWLGYDPPGTVPDAARTTRAAAGAVDFERFLGALRSTHRTGVPPHITALGHSYGSLLVGLAAQRPGGVPADELVLIGSPGTGADHASRLGVRDGHVWVGAAPHDPVTRLPAPSVAAAALLAGTGQSPLGLLQLRADRGHLTWFGADPAAPAFGARRLPADDGPPGGFGAAHSHYLDPGSRSLAAVAAVITGRQGP